MATRFSNDSAASTGILDSNMSLPNGVYRISKWGVSQQPQVLTLTDDGNVTILPPGAAPERAQKVTF